MSYFYLAGEAINVNQFTGFERPDDIQAVAILSSETSDHDTVLQQGNVGMPIATLGGRTSDYEQIQLIREYRNSHARVDLIEPDGGTHEIVVMSLSVTKVSPMLFLWDWTATVIETQSTGSGS